MGEKKRPSDADIIAAVGSWNASPTFVVGNRLNRKWDVGTPWVLRQLKRLELSGKVARVSSSYAVMLSWSLPKDQDQKGSGE